MEIVELLSDLEEADLVEIEPVGSHFNVEIFKEIRSKDGSTWQVLFFISESKIRVNNHGAITVYEIPGTDEG